MTRERLPELGKATPEFFDRVIFPRLGRKDPDIIVGPRHGVDFGVLDLGDRVLVTSSDPFYIASELGMERAAWFAVHILASDVAVSGIMPGYMAVDLNLPPEMSESDLELMWDSVHRTCRELDIAVITGHTARYAGCNYPMVGGATVFGLGPKEDLVIPQAAPGDMVVVTKGPAVEATGLMAAYFPDRIEEAWGPEVAGMARDMFYNMSVVKDARVAASVGGVSAMHDATECGILGGLWEMAAHSGVGIDLDLAAVVFPEVIEKTCECFGLDPFSSISEGTLLATVRPEAADDVVAALGAAGIEASIAGRITDKSEGMRYRDGAGVHELRHPRTDPFWAVFQENLSKR